MDLLDFWQFWLNFQRIDRVMKDFVDVPFIFVHFRGFNSFVNRCDSLYELGLLFVEPARKTVRVYYLRFLRRCSSGLLSTHADGSFFSNRVILLKLLFFTSMNIIPNTYNIACANPMKTESAQEFVLPMLLMLLTLSVLPQALMLSNVPSPLRPWVDNPPWPLSMLLPLRPWVVNPPAPLSMLLPLRPWVANPSAPLSSRGVRTHTYLHSPKYSHVSVLLVLNGGRPAIH